jgi:hypothetical protein
MFPHVVEETIEIVNTIRNWQFLVKMAIIMKVIYR